MAELKYLVRVANTDLKGSKPIGFAMLSIRGVGFSFANMACALAKINPMRKAGELSDKEVAAIEAVITNPAKHGVPAWFLNRQRDYETGENQHLLGPNIKFIQDNDVRRLKKIKSYRGLRHALGLPTRGQKMRSNFRKNKGKTVGVMKSAAAKAPAEDKKK
ncbi:30S ribosomal protein S13 [Candidatus Woesearchaeota archaeon]|nr:30S ribosomal protein S13 [Candidatus Woesearchaeota archaeon]